uniref:DMT family transporter n=1 Tax=Marinactinospora thermotolerans TaxID=531310 RepID=UPI00190E656A|nr:SMR family transporter [Marinactinospora thermotolerans]
MKWALLAGAIVSEVTATLSLRAAIDAPWWYAVVVVGYGAAFTLLALVLARGMPVGVAYGIWAAAGVALTALLATLLFDDPFTWPMAAGIALIIGGVLLVETGSHTAEKETV